MLCQDEILSQLNIYCYYRLEQEEKNNLVMFLVSFFYLLLAVVQKCLLCYVRSCRQLVAWTFHEHCLSNQLTSVTFCLLCLWLGNY